MGDLYGLVNTTKWPYEPAHLERFDVHAKVVNKNADVTCKFAYKNDTSELMESNFVFPLEANAAVFELEAIIGTKRLVATCRERKEVSPYILFYCDLCSLDKA